MKLRSVDHINIVVKDIEAAVAYYQKLGLTVEGTLEEGSVVFLWNGDGERPVRIELHQARPQEETGLAHIAFLVDDVEASYRALRAEGIEFQHEPFHQPLSGRTIATFQDPDGIGLQLARKTSRGAYEDFL